MKLLIGLLAISLAWNGALTLPARSPSDDAEVIAVPKQRPAADDGTDFRNYNGVIDTGVGYPFLQPNPHPFSFNFGFFDSFEDIFRRLRAHLIPVERPSSGDGSDSTEEADCLDAKKFNETSSVKIVDGLKIEVNETVYGDDNSSFKIRIINVRPVGSGEDGGGDVDEAAATEAGESSADPDYRKAVTSAPAPKKNKDREEIESDDNDRDDDNDGRREPLARSPAENEHSSDEQYARTTTMLPATGDADNAANLNAAFVTDNSLEMGEASVQHGSGNIESETNKPDDVTSEQRDEAALDVEQQPHGDAVNSRLLANERPTIENNEESEVNDNFNESPTDASTAAAAAAAEDDFTERLHELQLSGQDGGESLANDGADIVEDVAHIDDSDADGADVVERMATHSNYKQREDVASSDDDSDAEKVEMTPEFYAEWSELAGESTNGDDSRRQAVEHNDLDNEIDAYDSVPVDLSNDIAVNDIAAAQPDYPRNPDAEFIDVDGMMMSESMPKFERLSSIDSPIRSTSYQPAGYAHNMK